MITVKELQELLSTLHPDDVVILASDGEGNRILPLYEVSEDHYHTGSKELWEVTEHGGHLTDKEIVPCVVLWPTH